MVWQGWHRKDGRAGDDGRVGDGRVGDGRARMAHQGGQSGRTA